MDALCLLIVVGFFALSGGLIELCARLKEPGG